MITLFSGEFTLVPEALDVSHNWCTHNCGYCFANNNKPDRRISTQHLFNQITNFHKQKNEVAFMLQHGMTVTASNKTDPFAKSNNQIAVPMFELFDEYKIKYSLQTRGGDGVDKIIQTSPKVWYVSITHTSDETRKKTESGATSIEYRWELVKELIKNNHKVIVAYNPFWHEWIDIDAEIKKIKDHKIEGVVIQKMHLNNLQYGNMTDRYKEVFKEIFEQTKNKFRRVGSENEKHFNIFYERLRQNGIKVKSYSHSNNDNLYSIYADVYGKKSTFRTTEDFIGWCYENKKDGDEVYFYEWYDFFTKDLPFKDKEFNIQTFFRSIKTIDRTQTIKYPNKGSIMDVLTHYWNDLTLKRHLTMSTYFSLLVDDKNKSQRLVDYYRNNIVVFNRNKHTSFTTSLSNQS